VVDTIVLRHGYSPFVRGKVPRRRIWDGSFGPGLYGIFATATRIVGFGDFITCRQRQSRSQTRCAPKRQLKMSIPTE
jgi:hypothetical protein